MNNSNQNLNLSDLNNDNNLNNINNNIYIPYNINNNKINENLNNIISNKNSNDNINNKNNIFTFFEEKNKINNNQNDDINNPKNNKYFNNYGNNNQQGNKGLDNTNENNYGQEEDDDIEEQKKEIIKKIVNEIFQDIKKLELLKKRLGEDIGEKLFSGNIDVETLYKVAEILKNNQLKKFGKKKNYQFFTKKKFNQPSDKLLLKEALDDKRYNYREFPKGWSSTKDYFVNNGTGNPISKSPQKITTNQYYY
jgi:hypothetical protein